MVRVDVLVDDLDGVDGRGTGLEVDDDRGEIIRPKIIFIDAFLLRCLGCFAICLPRRKLSKFSFAYDASDR